MTELPTLSASSARIDLGGLPQAQDLSLETAGEWLGLLGDWEPLFDALTGRSLLVGGTLTILGTPVSQAAAAGVVGVARRDPPLPKGWKAIDYAIASARLGGHSRRDARQAAQDTFHHLGITAMGSKRVEALMPVERRALGIAHAIVTNPPVVALEAPLHRLDDQEQSYLSQLLRHAATGRRLLVSVHEVPPSPGERTLLSELQEVLLVARGALVARGSVADVLPPGRRFSVTVTRHASQLADALVAAGIAVQRTAGTAESARLFVSLPDPADTSAILDAALRVEAPIVEMKPT